MIRVGLLMGSGTALAAPVLLLRVHAAGHDTDPQKRGKFRPSQLPIYAEPERIELEVIPEAESSFRQYVSSARKWTWHYLESVQSTTNKLKEKWDVGKAHTQDALAYIREDSSVIPRAAFITVAGLGGVVAGYKGGLIRKALYAAVGMGVAASVCYPHEAEDIAKQGLYVVKDFAYKTYEDSFGGSKGSSSDSKKSKVPETKPEPTPKAADSSSAKKDSDSSSVKKDFGMSKPEDKELFAKRGN